MPMTRSRSEIDKLLVELEHRTADELEDQRLDFKEWVAGGMDRSIRSVVAAAVCMANGGGGTVVFGVADNRVGRESAVREFRRNCR